MPGIAYRRLARNQCTCKWKPAGCPIVWQYSNFHLQQIRSDRYIIEHIHKAHSSNHGGCWQHFPQKAKHHHGRCALSLSLSQSRSLTHVNHHSSFSNCKARLLHLDQHQPQGILNHAVTRSRKGYARAQSHTLILCTTISCIITIQSLQRFKR